MKAQDIRKMTVEELYQKSTDLNEELCKLKFQHSIRPLENTARLKEMRQDRARVNTILNEKRLS